MKHVSASPHLEKEKLVPVDLKRDQCIVVRRSGDPEVLKKSLVAMRRILKDMPLDQNFDSVAEVRRHRSQI